VAAEELVGFITLSERVTGLPLSFEDFSLLMIMAEQTAGSIRNIRLSEQLRLAKQMEMFQTVAAFFVHDLKNMASTLSLTLQNLPVYFDNPEFRQDTLRVIGQSVEKINGMCGRLSLLRQKLELDRSETDLNRVVSDVLSELNGAVQSAVAADLQPIPPLLLDSDQIRKVVMNLVLNAKEAIGADGHINIRTYLHGDYAMLSVADNGCGISKAFLEQSIFSPFRTTKEKGLGIGLYQCKMIVEAHQGRIEVESQEGTGSTFRVMLPAGKG
jgi:putative PEP-CTERM system histidine kinase